LDFQKVTGCVLGIVTAMFAIFANRIWWQSAAQMNAALAQHRRKKRLDQ